MAKVGRSVSFRFWVVLGLLALTVIWFLPWRFQTNDDTLMMWLVSGAYTGEPESYAVFIHPLLSWSFSKLYTFYPAIPWYPVIWFLVMYLSYWVVLDLVWKRSAQSNFKNLCSIFIFCIVVHFLLFLQFTIVAGFAAFAGFSSLIVQEDSKIGKVNLQTWLLFGFSILIRWESFVLISLGFFLYLIILKQDFLKTQLIRLFPLLMVFLVLTSTRVIWENNSPYSDFIAYNKARASVSDHPVMYRFLKEEKIEKSDPWFYFTQWMMDEDSITLAQLKEKKQELDSELHSITQVRSSLARVYEILKSEVFKVVFSILLVLGFIFSTIKQKNKIAFLSIWVIFFLIFNHYFILNGRVIILFILPLAFPIIAFPIELKKGVFAFYFGLLVILLTIHLWNFLREGEGRQIMKLEFLTVLEKVPSKSLLFLEGYKENYLGISYSAQNPLPFLSFGWISKSPFQKKALKKFELAGLKSADRYFLIGVDVHEEFFFPGYMNIQFGKFSLVQKRKFSNFILFEYQKE